MKFGKTIQSQQVPGWGDYYLNYKALKKIINSYAAGRPASDASLLSLGLRPAKRSLSTSERTGDDSPSSDVSPTLPPVGKTGDSGSLSGHTSLMDRSGVAKERNESFKAHRDVFFFTLQRELEKINAFYLIKERDLRLRLLTLLLNRKRLLQTPHLDGSTPMSDDEDSGLESGIKRSNEWSSLEEGWRLFERDLGKLQGFIEINATGFRKILKKWDKRSKSNTKEMYLERQVEVQPCFNREFIARLSDVVAANLLDLENGSEKLPKAIFADLGEALGADGLSFERQTDFDIDMLDTVQTMAAETLVSLESNLEKSVSSGRDAIKDWVKTARARQKRNNDKQIMRIIWRAALQIPSGDLELLLHNVQLDFGYVDEINGRTPLHQACIAGVEPVVKLCVERSAQLMEKRDTYERTPLHYATMHGHSEIVSYLLEKSADPTTTDMDGYTPLMHAIVQGHLDVVRIFVKDKITLEPTAVSNDLIPLSLACQFGHVEVARLLLRCGAKVLPNSEGMYPQHFAAKAGHEDITQLLVDEGGPDGGGKDRQDKYNLWTPMHHAAVGGGPHHLACIEILISAGCDVNVTDEYGKSPGWYAAWYGHVECLKLLIASGARLSDKQQTLESMENLGLSADPQMDSLSPGSDLDLDQTASGEPFDLIPSLSLPPPIIPLRVYGHEFLAHRSLVQLSLGHRDRSSSKAPPVKLYSRSGQDALHLWSSLKLVMTSKSDITAVPHSVILPLADEREVFSFQVKSLERFTLELSLYPTFGSKVIGRAVILPSTFLDIRYHKGFVVPLLDHQIKAIGEVAFEVSCIKPFEGAQLEIGGRVETYWKSKVTPSTPSQDHAHQVTPHRPLSVSTSSPALQPPAVAPSTTAKESALVTASSLSGEYIEAIVQVTSDGVPVIYPTWSLPVPDLDVSVSEVTFAQFQALANRSGRSKPQWDSITPAGLHKIMTESMISLEELLSHIPSEVGLNVQLRYGKSTKSPHGSGRRSAEVNEFVDTVLHQIYQAGKMNPGRKIIFSSFDPTVCTALNWKQPNYAVFFASYCGISPSRSGTDLKPASLDEQSDPRCLSVREAVNFAKTTNLLGVILEATTLAAVPSLLASVKDAGLLLAAFGDPAHVASLRSGAPDGRTVDAFVADGTMTLTI